MISQMWAPLMEMQLIVVSKELSEELRFKLRIVKMRDQMWEELGKSTTVRKTADTQGPEGWRELALSEVEWRSLCL